jgi:hypothetical protein
MRTPVPDCTAHPNSQPYAPTPGETPGTLSAGLNREDTEVLVARGYDAHLVRVGSGRRAHPIYGPLPGALTGNVGRARPGVPRLYIPSDAPLRPYQGGGEVGRRPSVTSSNALEGMAGLRSRDIRALDRTLDNEPDGHFYFHGSQLGPGQETPPSSQRPFRAPPPPHSQLGIPHQFGDSMDSPTDRTGYGRTAHYSYQTTLTSPTIVSPPTPSTIFEEGPGFPGGIKGSRFHVVNASHFESDLHEKSDMGHRRADPEGVVGKPRDECRDTMYSDFFGGRGTTYLETDSVNSRRADTPFSDKSSVLIPRRASSDALSSMAKMAQNRPTNVQCADIPLMVPTKPTSRPTSRPRSYAEEEEEPLHCDELNAPPHKALSKMEKAILRRIEFGQNIDLSRIQLS